MDAVPDKPDRVLRSSGGNELHERATSLSAMASEWLHEVLVNVIHVDHGPDDALAAGRRIFAAVDEDHAEEHALDESAEQVELAESDAASLSLRDGDTLLAELIRHLDAAPKSMLQRLLHLSS